MSRAILPVMVGTAGHIDHGKSSLVRVLTGIDPDRLKEEKERGLTIDLGFARFTLRDGRLLGLVDVPGHERFVKNMVAGSTALDIALLVIAADDSVMPKTIEHVEILQLLGVQRMIVVLSKIDAVDAETAELAEQEIRELLAPTPFAEATIVRVSSITRQGIDELRGLLESTALGVPARSAEGAFRMPIQRVFKLEGIGTVVTGIPLAGSIHSGEEIEFLPGGETVRVRALQAFGGAVDRVVAGHSSALSVPDARDLTLHRGQVAAAPGVYHAGSQIDVDLSVLAKARAIRHRDPIRFHTGTAELRGVLSVLEGDVMEPGRSGVARVLLDEEVYCAPGDRFLLRAMNPPRTIGGGRVLQVVSEGGRYRRQRIAEQVRSLIEAGTDPAQRAFEIVRHAGPAGMTGSDVARALAVSVESARDLLAGHPEIHWHARTLRAFAKDSLDDGRAAVLASVDRILRDKQMAASVLRSALRTTHDFPPELKEAVLDQMVAEGRARSTADGKVMFLDRLRPLAAEDQIELDRIVSACEAAAFRPPTAAELASSLGVPMARVEGLLARGVDEGRIERVGEHAYGAGTMRRVLVEIARNALAHGEVLDIPALRDALDTSRKYLIPLLEHVDGMGLTRLRAGERRLLTSSDAFAALRSEPGLS